MSQALDGIRARKRFAGRVSASWTLKWRVGRGLFLILPFLLVGLWVQPLVAALPVDSWPERITLARLLKPGRYLVLFQNPRELRPTGGFIGSFAEVSLGWGLTVRQVEVDTNIFKRDTAHKGSLGIRAPDPIHEFTLGQPWALHNSNWALDFPEAAQTVAWFYEREGGRPVDGVIALDARILERILRLVGPIDQPADDLYLDVANVIDAIQEEVEKNYWIREGAVETNEPKTVLANLLPIVWERLKAQSVRDLAALATDALAAKEAQIFVRDLELARFLARKNWDGHLRTAETDDFLHLNEANLTAVDIRGRALGAKSSHSIERQAILQRDRDGEHRLALTRVHRGVLRWPDGPNTSFLRLAVPLGTTLTSVARNGADVTSEVRESREAGVTVFGFWSRLAPGETETFEIVYATPAEGPTNFLFQRQAGSPSPTFELWDGSELRFSGIVTDDLIFAPPV